MGIFAAFKVINYMMLDHCLSDPFQGKAMQRFCSKLYVKTTVQFVVCVCVCCDVTQQMVSRLLDHLKHWLSLLLFLLILQFLFYIAESFRYCHMSCEAKKRQDGKFIRDKVLLVLMLANMILLNTLIWKLIFFTKVYSHRKQFQGSP